jgi:uncharacterized protein (TIGR02145 family)
MKKIIVFFIAAITIFSCSTNNDSNNSATAVIPLAPTTLTGSLTNSTQVTINWTDNSTNETGFKIERKIGTGNYSQIGSNITDITTYIDSGLLLSTSYTYRVLSYNAVGNSITYSNEFSIITSNPLTIPVLTTDIITEITATSAVSGGNITYDGGSPVISRGVVWSTSSNPIISLSTKTVDGVSLANFSSSLTGLLANTKYYVRAYASNAIGTAYGNELSITTQPPAAILPSVTICNQVWMSSNLNVSQYRNGDVIPQVTDPTQWKNMTTGAWCYYNNDSSNGAIYGKLYNWYAVNDPRGLAPQGWHVSTTNEWSTLTTCLGGDQVAGGPLKETGTSHWNSPNLGATNATGFTALPGGSRNGTNGVFDYKGIFADWWVSNTNNINSPTDHILSYNYIWVSSLGPYKNEGLSIRCVKD